MFHLNVHLLLYLRLFKKYNDVFCVKYNAVIFADFGGLGVKYFYAQSLVSTFGASCKVLYILCRTLMHIVDIAWR